MDIEEFKKLMKSAEGKAAMQSVIDEATSSLNTKNEELIGKLKKLQDAKKELETKIEEFEEGESEKNKKSGEWEKEKKKLEDKFTTQIKELTEKLTGSEGTINKLVIDNGLSDALAKANIAPVHMKAVQALLRSSNKIDISVDGDKHIAKIGDKALGDFIKTWAESDEGKHYVAAQNNSGGGARGSQNNNSGTGDADTSKMSPVQRLTMARKQGKK